MGAPNLTEEQIEQIAEKAAEKAIEKLTSHVYQEVGKSVVGKLFYIIGACAIGLYLWLKSKGII
jgi:tetrahydromethanopterin S-methyltransferase subunit G